MKKVIILTTGGTIAMKYDQDKGGFVPAVTGDELVEVIPDLKNHAKVQVVEFSNVPSPHMTPELMCQLKNKADEILQDPDVAGIVITHGTDTIEETAYFLDLSLESDKPVALTAAMRGSDELGADGPLNILSSVRTVVDPKAVGMGVFVVANQEIHSAQNVTKTHTGNVACFKSPFWGPVAYADDDKIVWMQSPIRKTKFVVDEVDYKDIHLVKMYTGASEKIIDYLVEDGAKGLVIEALGRGNVPPNVGESIFKALDKNIPVILNSRCLGGRPLDTYAYLGGGKELTDRGAILAGDINSQKARIKLILALNSKDYRYEDLKTYFD